MGVIIFVTGGVSRAVVRCWRTGDHHQIRRSTRSDAVGHIINTIRGRGGTWAVRKNGDGIDGANDYRQ